MKIVGTCTFYCNDDGDHDVVAHLVCGCEYMNDALIPCPEHEQQGGGTWAASEDVPGASGTRAT